jgi:DNA-binding NarL/FixJ family response regulator
MDEMADREIRVFVCDRQPLVCEGITAVLEREPGIAVTGAATTLEDAIVAVRLQRPAVAVIGHDPPRFDGIELMQTLEGLGLGDVACILLLDDSTLDGSLVRALQVGAHGVLGKEQAPGMLASAVRSLSAGSIVIGPPAVAHLAGHLARAGRPELARFAEGRLSSREFQVFELAARGLTNRELAASLSLSVTTVKSHLHSVCRKLGLRDRIQVVILAYESGIVRPSGDHEFGRPRAAEGPPGR